jgi:hypothetical protein
MDLTEPGDTPQATLSSGVASLTAAPQRGAGNCATSHNGPADDLRPITAQPAQRTARKDAP